MSYHFRLTCPGIYASHSEFDNSRTEKFERHCHSNYELIYIWQGEGKYIVEGVEYPLHPRMLLLMRPYEYHYVCPKLGQSYERTVINFEESALPSSLRSHPLLQKNGECYFPMEGLDDPIHTAYQTLGAVQRLMGEKAEATPEAQAFLQASTVQIFLLLTLRTAKRVGSEESNTVLRVIEYVNSHLNEELSLDDIARDFFISKYHLCRIFHKQTGASIFTYYNTKRMALAQQMINSGESATAVALRLGFRDYSTFYRTFRKQTGHSPVRKIPQKELEEAK